MKYDDDQCERCGGVRVAKSTLCAECLVKERGFLNKEILIKDVAIEMLRKKLETQTGRLQDACHYGFRRNQENLVLRSRIKGLLAEIASEGTGENGKLHEIAIAVRDLIEEGLRDGKDRVHEDKQEQERGCARKMYELRGER